MTKILEGDPSESSESSKSPQKAEVIRQEPRERELRLRIHESLKENADRVIKGVEAFITYQISTEILAILAENLKTKSGEVYVTATRLSRGDKDIGDFRLWEEKPKHHDGHFDSSSNSGIIAGTRAPTEKIRVAIDHLLNSMMLIEHQNFDSEATGYVDKSDIYRLKRKIDT